MINIRKVSEDLLSRPDYKDSHFVLKYRVQELNYLINMLKVMKDATVGT